LPVVTEFDVKLVGVAQEGQAVGPSEQRVGSDFHGCHCAFANMKTLAPMLSVTKIDPSSRTARSLQNGVAVGMARVSLDAGLAHEQAARLLIGEYANQGALVGARIDPLGADVFRWDAPDRAGAEAADDDRSIGGGGDAFREEALTQDRDDGWIGGIKRASPSERLAAAHPILGLVAVCMIPMMTESSR